MDTFYEEDILGEGFQRTTLFLRDDYEGSAVATLVRRLSDTGNGRSVLYIHGFNDYFFQREIRTGFAKIRAFVVISSKV